MENLALPVYVVGNGMQKNGSGVEPKRAYRQTFTQAPRSLSRLIRIPGNQKGDLHGWPWHVTR